jgi:hypothetical protein
MQPLLESVCNPPARQTMVVARLRLYVKTAPGLNVTAVLTHIALTRPHARWWLLWVGEKSGHRITVAVPAWLPGEFRKMQTRWRRGWDSNPRATRAAADFQDRCLQPLGHPSKCSILPVFFAFGHRNRKAMSDGIGAAVVPIRSCPCWHSTPSQRLSGLDQSFVMTLLEPSAIKFQSTRSAAFLEASGTA